jgi:chaperonin GroES
MLRPLFDNVLVIEIDQERKIEGVDLPNIAKEDMKLGKVVGCGSGCREVKLKDLVCFGPHAGMPYSINGTEFLLMKEPEIKGVLEASPDAR